MRGEGVEQERSGGVELDGNPSRVTVTREFSMNQEQAA